MTVASLADYKRSVELEFLYISASIWNPGTLYRVGLSQTYWYVPVHTNACKYRSVQEFHVRTSTCVEQDMLLSQTPRKVRRDNINRV